MDNPFPPLNDQIPVKSVYERAGFEMNKLPLQNVKKRQQSIGSISIKPSHMSPPSLNIVQDTPINNSDNSRVSTTSSVYSSCTTPICGSSPEYVYTKNESPLLYNEKVFDDQQQDYFLQKHQNEQQLSYSYDHHQFYSNQLEQKYHSTEDHLNLRQLQSTNSSSPKNNLLSNEYCYQSVNSFFETSPTLDHSVPPQLPEKRPRKLKGICRGCNLEIYSKCVFSKNYNLLSGKWHKKCFCCASCGTKQFQPTRPPAFNTVSIDANTSSDNEFYVLNNNPLCHKCYHMANSSLCTICATGIEGEYLDDGHYKYHLDCLTCAYCNHVMNSNLGSILLKNGQLCCPNHPELFSCNRNVEKRRTRLMNMF